eukprot:scaffold2261_cov231-Pinguiococcus_pyrenoidosus.AAC.2
MHRQGQAQADEHGEKAHGFQHDGFASGVGPTDEKRLRSVLPRGVEEEVVADDFGSDVHPGDLPNLPTGRKGSYALLLGLLDFVDDEDGMLGRLDVDDPLLANLRTNAFPDLPERQLGLQGVERGGSFDRPLQLGDELLDEQGQLREDAGFLAAQSRPELAQLVRRLNQCLRLHVHGLPTPADVVHDAHAALLRRSDGHNVAAVDLVHGGVAELIREGVVAEQLLQLRVNAGGGRSDPLAQASDFWKLVPIQLSVIVEGSLEPILQLVWDLNRLRKLLQQWDDRLLIHGLHQKAAKLQQRRGPPLHGDQLVHLDGRQALGPLQRRREVHVHGQRESFRQALELLQSRVAALHRLHVALQGAAEHFLLGRRGHGLLGQRLQHPGKVQHLGGISLGPSGEAFKVRGGGERALLQKILLFGCGWLFDLAENGPERQWGSRQARS